MSRPDLYVFAISHYCEKARWALDWLGLDYSLRHLAPGAHMQVAKQLGAPGSSVPILVADELVVQGSGAILDWADGRRVDDSRRLAPETAFEAECRALEQRLDDVAGVHVRRYYYSEALVEHPDSVRPLFVRDLSPAEREPFEASWDLVRQLMTARMDLGREQGEASRAILETELDWLDARLAEGRRYLVGDRFGRADITAASLLAPLVVPPEHPTYAALAVPPRARADLARWTGRPSLAWVRELYRDHRAPRPR